MFSYCPDWNEGIEKEQWGIHIICFHPSLAFPSPLRPASSPFSSPFATHKAKGLKESDIMKIKIKGIMGKLLCHMWLLGLPCPPGGNEWLWHNIFFVLFIHSSLMSKNRKCVLGPTILRPVIKRDTKEFSPSLSSRVKIKDTSHPLSCVYNWAKLNWHKCAARAPFYKPFQNTSFTAVFLEFTFNLAWVHPHLQWRVRSFLPT